MKVVERWEDIGRFSFAREFLAGGRRRGSTAVPTAALIELCSLTGSALTDLAGACVLAPVFETKVAAAFAVEELATAYAALHRRLVELKTAPPGRVGTDPVLAPAGAWPTMGRIVEEALRPALQRIDELLAAAHGVAEWPTVRMLERAVRPGLALSVELIARLLADVPDAGRMAQMADRDERYRLFNETGDYGARSGDYQIDPRGNTDDELLASLIAQVRVQRDELDAVETFARLLAAAGELTPADLLALARVVADEARHTISGELGLRLLGLDPFSVPIGVMGAELRRGLDPWDGLAQLCLIGESGNLRRIGKSSSRAATMGEAELSDVLGTIYQDERFHIALGIRLLMQKHPGALPSELQARALESTNAYLAGRGIPPVGLSDAARLLGE